MKKVLFFLPLALVCFANAPKLPKDIKKSFSLIPSGIAVVGNDTLSLQSYYICNFEVSNADYKKYLDYLEKQGNSSALENARIRNENWVKLNYKSTAEQYHTHVAFASYPVVNVTYLGAVGYCNFMAEKLNVLLKKSGFKVRIRLPFHAEIIRAGVGDNHHLKYPWEHSGVQNKKGEFMSNHRLESNTNGQNQASNDLLAPVKSYWASPLGVFNLSGNAAEMTNIPGVAVGGSWLDAATESTLQSKLKYEESACTVGFRVVITWQQD